MPHQTKPDRSDAYFHGRPYALLIDPSLEATRRRVREWIPPGSTVLDVGCGTGDQLYALGEVITRGLGIDPSPTQIGIARRRREAVGMDHLEFRTADAGHLLELREDEFDFALATLVIHEMPEDGRLPLLKAMRTVARQVIVVDWNTEQSTPWHRASMHGIELLAGWRHYRGFRSFARNGGMGSLLRAAHLDIMEEREIMRGMMRQWLCR